MPKRIDPPYRRSEQLLLRLTVEELEWVESAAHLERCTPNAYVYELVRAHVASLAHNEHVRADLANRRAYKDAQATTLSFPRRSSDPSGQQDSMHENLPGEQRP